MYFPVWGGYLLYFLFHWKWAMWMATAVLAFWAAPFTPFFPLCISLTLALRKFILKIHHRVQRTLHRHSASEKSIWSFQKQNLPEVSWYQNRWTTGNLHALHNSCRPSVFLSLCSELSDEMKIRFLPSTVRQRHPIHFCCRMFCCAFWKHCFLQAGSRMKSVYSLISVFLTDHVDHVWSSASFDWSWRCFLIIWLLWLSDSGRRCMKNHLLPETGRNSRSVFRPGCTVTGKLNGLLCWIPLKKNTLS